VDSIAVRKAQLKLDFLARRKLRAEGLSQHGAISAEDLEQIQYDHALAELELEEAREKSP
jgi:multidrug resistance efflux pump